MADVSSLFPLLLPEDESFTRYKGYITVQGTDYGMELVASGSMRDAQLILSDELASLLGQHISTVKQVH